jgi:hypothetical protein
MFSANIATTCEPCMDMTGVIPPLHHSILDVLPLTSEERATCQVFALNSDYRQQDDEATCGRFAIAAPVARADWHRLTPGQVLLFTEVYHFPEPENAGTSAYITHCGPLRTYDARRGLFYACSWRGGDGELDCAADDVQEVWAVHRFIEGSNL